MEILTYINFLGAGEAAQTGDNINIVLLLLVICALIITASVYFVLKSNRVSSTLKKVIGIGLPSVFLVLAIPLGFATQSHADGSSTSLDAIVDPETCTAYIQDGIIQNTTSDDMMLIVANSQAINAGVNIPGLQNANLKVTVGDYVIFEGNPFDDYDSDLYEDYVLKPGQAVQYTTELTGLDQATCYALFGSGNSIQMRFKFYYAFDWDGHYKITNEAQSVADYLYEVEYESWNVDKCNFICECIGKSAYIWGPDTKEYKDYLRKEWGLNEDQIQLIVQIRKYFEETDPYFPALCTSCRNGNYIGRNFDWAYDDLDEYVVRADKTKDHFQSIGVVSSFFPQALQEAINIKTMLPMLTMDGINKNGVAININIVPPDAFGATTGTNPGAKRLCAGVIPRFVLDNASTAAEAVELLKNRDIFTVCFSEFHFMISDKNESYIVETCNNELVVLKQEVKQEDPKPTAMSNFHVSNSDYYDDYECVCGKTEIGPTWAAHSLGVERYALAMEGIESVDSLQAMVNHMKPIYYKEVNTNWANKRFWSDKNGQPSDKSDHVFSYYDKDEGTKWDAEREYKFQKNEENYNQIHAREKQIGQRVLTGEGFNGVSQTVNSSCYDIENRKLALTVQERAVTFNFNLNGTFREGATGIFVNGDNVGLATKSTEPRSEWSYNPTTHELKLETTTDALYSITGQDADVKIITSDKVGSSIIIPLMDHVQTKVEIGKTNPKIVDNARKGVRVVPLNSYVTVTFKADTGYKFKEDNSDYHIVYIEKMGKDNIIFGETPNYDLPTVVEIDD